MRASLLVPAFALAALWACAKSNPVGFQPVAGSGGTAGSAGSGGDEGGAGGSGNAGNQGGSGNVGNQGGSGNAGNQGGSGNTGNVGNQGGSGNSGNQGGSPPACMDSGPGEPNETEIGSMNLGSIDDCDGSGSSLAGIITGPNDVDWYRYTGSDSFGCVVDPTRTFSSSDSLRICKFLECSAGGAISFSCPAGTTDATSPGGRPGCCSSSGFDVSPDCSGVDDDTVVFIRIDDPQGLQCVTYDLAWHY